MGNVDKDKISKQDVDTKRFWLRTFGGKGFEVYETSNGAIRKKEKKFYDYEMVVKYYGL